MLLRYTCWLTDFVTRCLYTMQFWTCHIAYRVLRLCWKDRDRLQKTMQLAITSQLTVSFNPDSFSVSIKTSVSSCWERPPQILVKDVLALGQILLVSDSQGTGLGPLRALKISEVSFLVMCRQRYWLAQHMKLQPRSKQKGSVSVY